MIVRSHVANNGAELVFVGNKLPWEFKKGSQSFSRKLEQKAEIIHIKDDAEFFNWAKEKKYDVIAIEISEDSELLNNFKFPENCAIVLGNEANGLPKEFVSNCKHIVTIPQFGSVGSLNVAVSASIAMYELNRNKDFEVKIKNDQFCK